jgi:hypothetical protein
VCARSKQWSIAWSPNRLGPTERVREVQRGRREAVRGVSLNAGSGPHRYHGAVRDRRLSVSVADAAPTSTPSTAPTQGAASYTPRKSS